MQRGWQARTAPAKRTRTATGSRRGGWSTSCIERGGSGCSARGGRARIGCSASLRCRASARNGAARSGTARMTRAERRRRLRVRAQCGSPRAQMGFGSPARYRAPAACRVGATLAEHAASVVGPRPGREPGRARSRLVSSSRTMSPLGRWCPTKCPETSPTAKRHTLHAHLVLRVVRVDVTAQRTRTQAFAQAPNELRRGRFGTFLNLRQLAGAFWDVRPSAARGRG